MLCCEEKLDTLINLFDEELAFRKKDLNNLKKIIDTTNIEIDKFTLMRNTFPSIYAHYEGFLKYSFWKVIEYIKDLDINIDELNPNFIILCLVPSLEAHIVKQVSKSQVMLSIFDKIYNLNQNIFDVMVKEKYVINHDTLKSTCDLMGICLENIESEQIVEKSFPMNELGIIYRRRNGIAHGELSAQKCEMFALTQSREISSRQVESAAQIWNEGFNSVLKALDLLKNIFLDYIIKERYKITIENRQNNN